MEARTVFFPFPLFLLIMGSYIVTDMCIKLETAIATHDLLLYTIAIWVCSYIINLNRINEHFEWNL
jgi:hypothetical protein